MKPIVVLGGGVGGIVAASELRRRLPKERRVVLVERQAEHVFPPSLLWVAEGTRRPERITRPVARMAHPGVELRIGEVQAIDPARRRVRVDGEELEAEHLVISLGADLAPERVPGLAEAGHDLYTLSGALGLRDAVSRMTGGRLVILTARPAYKCPAAPYEAAMLLESVLARRGVRPAVEVEIHAAEQGPMLATGKENSDAVRAMVEAKGIQYHPGRQVASVDGKAKRIRFEDGSEAPYDVLAYVPPHEAPKAVREAGLTDASGWIPVDRNTMATKFPGVWAIGDVTTIPLKIGRPLPKAGAFAHAQAEVVARNITSVLRGEPAAARFDGHGACFLETGNGRAGFGSGDFYAEPAPVVRLRKPGRSWHIGKILFEKRWLRRH